MLYFFVLFTSDQINYIICSALSNGIPKQLSNFVSYLKRLSTNMN